jgi:hypothetical protein
MAADSDNLAHARWVLERNPHWIAAALQDGHTLITTKLVNAFPLLRVCRSIRRLGGW